jgi:hypothetical protein
MPCLLALITFAILGIFSASHRRLAKEAFSCVFRRLTLRPCETNFNEKVRAKIVGGVLKRSQLAARLLNKHFEVIAWIFFIMAVASTGYILWGGYNFYMYGSCNGLNESGFCMFDPTGESNKISKISDSDTICSENERNKNSISLEGVNIDNFPRKNPGSKDSIVFIGCYNCDYTRKAYPLIQELVEKYHPDYTFIHLPVKEETAYLSNYVYCAYQQDKEKFWKFNDKLFSSSKENNENSSYVDALADQMGFDLSALKECVSSTKTKEIVEKQMQEIRNTGIYGTPTIFINGKTFVGPKPKRVYSRALGKLW